MGHKREVKPVKLIVGMLSQYQELLEQSAHDMRRLWGETDVVSEIMPFHYTRYYEKEMGKELLRQFVSFKKLIDPIELAGIKHQSNDLEADYVELGSKRGLAAERPVNLDPGYIEPSKLILATTKNYSHRVYIGQSMYAEVTLHYHQGRWQSWPFTYPDYGSGDYDGFLNQAREKLMEQLSSLKQNT